MTEADQISTHASLAGRDSISRGRTPIDAQFQPTRPLRDATPCSSTCRNPPLFQPTRPLRDATIGYRPIPRKHYKFQPTRPLRDATTTKKLQRADELLFQPTRPLRDATGEAEIVSEGREISTHASLAGRDVDDCDKEISLEGEFQPTRPLRDATAV